MHGKEGSFVIEDHGTFENGEANSTLQIIVGSGLGELKSIQGSGRYSASHDGAKNRIGLHSINWKSARLSMHSGVCF